MDNGQLHRFLILGKRGLKFIPERSDGNAHYQMQQERKEYRPQDFLSFASRLH